MLIFNTLYILKIDYIIQYNKNNYKNNYKK